MKRDASTPHDSALSATVPPDDTLYRIDALSRGIEVLKCLGSSAEPLSLKDICSLTQYPKASVFRYLQTLTLAGLVTHDTLRKLYRIDVRIAEKLGFSAALEGLRMTCLPFMENLLIDVTNFDDRIIVNLGVVEGVDVVYLDVVGSCQGFRTRSYIGNRYPTHTTALGKAILAHMSPEARSAVLPKVLRRRTTRSIIDKNVLSSALEEVRHIGYAEETGENEEGASCFGAPIFNSTGLVVAGLSLSTPCTDISNSEKQRYVTALLRTAEGISHELECRISSTRDMTPIV